MITELFFISTLLTCFATFFVVLSVELSRIYKRNRERQTRTQRRKWKRLHTIDGIKWYPVDELEPKIKRYGNVYSFSYDYLNKIL